jgi:hypothetical protein
MAHAILTLLAVILLTSSYSFAQSPRQEAVCSDSAVVFCENFEDRTTPSSLVESRGGKTTGWAVSDFSGSLTISTTEAAEGGRALQFNYSACSWSGSADGCGAGYMQSKLFAGLPDIYVRHYVKWAPGFVWSPTADKHMFVNSGNFREPSTFWTLWGSRQPMMLVTSPTYREYDQNVQSNDLVWQTGTWYCLEVHLTRVNSTTANIEGWVDGVQRWKYANVPASTTGNGWDSVEPAGYWNTSPTPGSRGAQTRWMDGIVVSKQRIGCLNQTTPPPISNAAPSPPLNVTIK